MYGDSGQARSRTGLISIFYVDNWEAVYISHSFQALIVILIIKIESELQTNQKQDVT